MQTIWLDPTGFVTGDQSLRVSYPYAAHPGTVISSKTAGDLKWVSEWVSACPRSPRLRKLSSAISYLTRRASFRRFGWSRCETPDVAIVHHDEAVSLNSTSSARHYSSVAPFEARGAVSLALRFNFHSKSHKITLGAVCVKIRHSSCACTCVTDYGAIGRIVETDASVQESGSADIRVTDPGRSRLEGSGVELSEPGGGVFRAKVLAISDDVLTLSAAPGFSATNVTVVNDDSIPIQAAYRGHEGNGRQDMHSAWPLSAR